MSLFPDEQPKTLEEALTKQAKSATDQTQDQFAQARKRQVAMLAHNGQLMSGGADYNLGDLDAQEGQAESGIHSNLASALAGVPTEDWLNTQQFTRQRDLASQIADLMKPSLLEEVFQGIGTGARIGGQAAAFGA